MANGVDIRRTPDFNPMYRSRKHIAQAQDYIDTQKQVQDAQLGRSEQKGAMSLWGGIGSIIGAYFGGPGGAAIGGWAGSYGADEYYDVEKLKIDEPLFGKSKVDILNQQLAATDKTEWMEHITTGIEAGGTAWTLGKASGLGGFGEEGIGEFGDKLWGSFRSNV